jgi:hypothetical protein
MINMLRNALVATLLAAVLLTTAGCARSAEPEPEPVYYWPLTGEQAPNGDATRTRVVSVKVENSSAARPQAGLADADVVYESLAEGGIPRFNALFHSSLPARVGPVRSARLSDTYLVPRYNALFAFSGASGAVRDAISAAGIDDLGMESYPELYERDSSRSAPHNVYSSVVDLQTAAADAGYESVAAPRTLVFGEVPEELAGAPVAARLEIPFAGGNDAAWMWDEAAGSWQRDVEGMPHADEGSGLPYSAANVIVLFAETVETGMRDSAGSVVLDIRLEGSGDAIVLRGGRRYDVRWTSSPDSPPRFATAEGTELPLAVGKTWIEVLPPDYEFTLE